MPVVLRFLFGPGLAKLFYIPIKGKHSISLRSNNIKYPGKLFTILLAALILPPNVTFIPQFLIFHRTDELNTFIPWVVFFISDNNPVQSTWILSKILQ